MTEKEFMQAVIDLCRYLGLKVYHPFDSRRSAPGYPDLTIVGKGVLFVETKTESGRLRPEQQEWLSALRAAGAEVHVWRPSHMPEITKRLRALAGKEAMSTEATAAEVSTHSVWHCEPCDCDAADDHDAGQEVRA